MANQSGIITKGVYQDGVVIPAQAPAFKVREVIVEFIPQRSPDRDVFAALAADDARAWQKIKKPLQEVRRALVKKKYPFLFSRQ